MCRKVICSVSFVLMLSLVGDVQAVTWVNWTDAGPDHLWSTGKNWDSGIVLTAAESARIDMLPGPIVTNEGTVADRVYVGNVGTGELTVDGGTLTISGWVFVGANAGSNGTFNMNSGAVNVADAIYVGNDGSGTLNMTGGTITLGADLTIGRTATATGHVNLDGGTITVRHLLMRRAAGSVGTMDVGGGTLIMAGNALSTVQGFIDNGWITAYDGRGMLLLDYDVTNEGKTTLKAVHMLNPNPADGGFVSPGEVELSWTLPDPCVPGQPVSVDVYFTDDYEALAMFTDPAAIRIVSKQNVTSVVVQTQPKTRYYWAVDTYVGGPNDPIWGPIFSFFADNEPPRVDAGADIVTWLVDGIMVKKLDATVTDEDAYAVQWTVVSEPNAGNAVIETPTSEDTSVTFLATGRYVLQLDASDGEYVNSDTITINVYHDGCEAARSLPGYRPLVGDLNGDCRVDDLDLALLQENWLKDNSLTEP
ncbi:MAG TPA: hypothetical protein VMW24_28955 [Sedimentisphaerales bacterium]|nr:hypothetical protein [Sedimentisphaerales bacterium]